MFARNVEQNMVARVVPCTVQYVTPQRYMKDNAGEREGSQGPACGGMRGGSRE